LYGNPHLLRDAGRIGIVTNQACFSARMEPSADVIFGATHRTTNARVTCVFGPQHGFHQTEQDNMIETPDTEYVYAHKDSDSNISNSSSGSISIDIKANSKREVVQTVPLFSLYSATRMPTDEQVSVVPCHICLTL
jgi:uncharacterized protein YbbC (DUF1343 family)